MTNTSDTSKSSNDESDDTSRETAKKSTGTGTRTRKRAAPERPQRPKRLRPTEALREAREQLTELTGKEVDSVASFRATDDGWLLEVEVLELSRVPDTMSLLATYEVALDHEGILTGYRRIRRYERGRSDDRR
ncbi:gas vesicle protein [Streptomyces sp. NPDC046939]|uniref:gas vesicle protein GvpO n=1 Tax=Streptomyces sp. NPDC046939 TaxID=3155376 RepID=UPI0033F557F3